MKLNWRSNGISDFIAESMDKVNAVDEVVRTMKNNLQVRTHTSKQSKLIRLVSEVGGGGGVDVPFE